MVVGPVTSQLKPKPRWGETGVELDCGHTAWGASEGFDFAVWLMKKYYRDGLWCSTCCDVCSVAGFWRPRG